MSYVISLWNLVFQFFFRNVPVTILSTSKLREALLTKRDHKNPIFKIKQSIFLHFKAVSCTPVVFSQFRKTIERSCDHALGNQKHIFLIIELHKIANPISSNNFIL